MKTLGRMAACCGMTLIICVMTASGQDSSTAREKVEFNPVPTAWRWGAGHEVTFSYDGTFRDSAAFVYDARTGRITEAVHTPLTAPSAAVFPEGAVNPTFSPDSSMVAYTKGGDLYVADAGGEREVRLTADGSDLILNGYASWVYYEEIFGRSTDYRAFWWSPDGKRIGFYRFDNSEVPLFPIYSPFGQDGTLISTRYPKAGENNPEVRIGIADVEHAFDGGEPDIVWADFDPSEDQYFGTPFWGADGESFFVSRMPRRQNMLDLYRVDVSDGSKSRIYHEEYPTWIDWIEHIVFQKDGLYMARSFETGWEQIYFLSYDGSCLKRLTDGKNWNIRILRADPRTGEVFFTADRDAALRQTLYKVDRRGRVTALTDPEYDVRDVKFSDDGRYFAASYSNSVTPVRVSVFDVSGRAVKERLVADMAPEGFDPEGMPLPELVWITVPDGFRIPASVTLPTDFDPAKKYPVHVDIYGGPDTPMVRDRWVTPTESRRWWADNGIIEVVADCRASGHNGRAGLDSVFGRLTVNEVRDFVEWAKWLRSLPYVDGDRIGVEGFSFGGTMTAMLLMQAPEYFRFGVAGGGVYDWTLYDSHYTERYMDTPQNNPEGYSVSRVLNYVDGYPAEYGNGTESAMLRLTHGTGDDNVHFQNTLQLIDALQKAGKKFDLMVYPDGKHGYRGSQHEHFTAGNREFWLRHLKGE